MMHCAISFALVIKATCTTADSNHVTFTELVSAEGMGSREQKKRWLCECALIGIFNESSFSCRQREDERERRKNAQQRHRNQNTQTCNGTVNHSRLFLVARSFLLTIIHHSIRSRQIDHQRITYTLSFDRLEGYYPRLPFKEISACFT